MLLKIDSLAELMDRVEGLEDANPPNQLTIGVSSAVTMNQLGLYLRKYGLLSDTRINVVNGNYNDPIGDADIFIKNKVDHAIFIPFFDNIAPFFEAQIPALSVEEIKSKEEEVRALYGLALKKCSSIKSIVLCKFHRMSRVSDISGGDIVDGVLDQFNRALLEEGKRFGNVKVIDTEDILKDIGRKNAFDARFYYLSKAPYAKAFFDELANRYSMITRGFGTHFYKALVLDCDNTLWGGVIGEDLLVGIKLDKFDYPGNIFWKIQSEIKGLEKNGVLLCLCSKNNIADVDEVLFQHPNMVLKDSDLVCKKVNWDDKPSNIRALAKELNIGLDSLVFLDDSPFECESVRLQLPMVKTIQVPKNLSEYPKLIADLKRLFLSGGISEESRSKTQQYRQRSEGEALKARFNSQEEYLDSLQIKIKLCCNAFQSSARVSELSMKSNQFNVATRRYTESEILSMMSDNKFDIYSLEVSDKFGSAGLTGVVVIKYAEDTAFVENFYMSCRVIGRGIEMGIWEKIFENAAKKGCKKLVAKYIESPKNSIVSDFFERLGLRIDSQADACRYYSIQISDFPTPTTPWIEFQYDE